MGKPCFHTIPYWYLFPILSASVKYLQTFRITFSQSASDQIFSCEMLLWATPALEIKETLIKKEALEDVLKNLSQTFSIHMGQHYSPQQPAISQKWHHVALL